MEQVLCQTLLVTKAILTGARRTGCGHENIACTWEVQSCRRPIIAINPWTTSSERPRSAAASSVLPYAGALLPAEAHQLMQAGAKLVDVRTKPELALRRQHARRDRARVADLPGQSPEPGFIGELAAVVQSDEPVMFLCRSGVRSHAAAEAAMRAGWKKTYNVLEGFEGDKDGAAAPQERRRLAQGRPALDPVLARWSSPASRSRRSRSTTMPKAMRYHANGLKSCVAT